MKNFNKNLLIKNMNKTKSCTIRINPNLTSIASASSSTTEKFLNKIMCVSSFIYDKKNNKVCIIKRNTSPCYDKYTFPGGKMETTDKNYLEATKREIFEETGYKISFPQYNLIEGIDYLPNYFILVSLSILESRAEDSVLDNHEIKNLGWFTQEEANKFITDENSSADFLTYVNKGFDLVKINRLNNI